MSDVKQNKLFSLRSTSKVLHYLLLPITATPFILLKSFYLYFIFYTCIWNALIYGPVTTGLGAFKSLFLKLLGLPFFDLVALLKFS